MKQIIIEIDDSDPKIIRQNTIFTNLKEHETAGILLLTLIRQIVRGVKKELSKSPKSRKVNPESEKLKIKPDLS
jgi:hypothetical protein